MLPAICVMCARMDGTVDPAIYSVQQTVWTPRVKAEREIAKKDVRSYSQGDNVIAVLKAGMGVTVVCCATYVLTTHAEVLNLVVHSILWNLVNLALKVCLLRWYNL